MASYVGVAEKVVKGWVSEIVRYVSKQVPLYSVLPTTFGYGSSGHPDRLILINGNFVGVEVKRNRDNHHVRPELAPKPNEAAQKIQFGYITRAGGDILVIYDENLHELINYFNKVTGGQVDWSGLKRTLPIDWAKVG